MVAEVTFKPGNAIRTQIKLPSSKSISNRALIIRAIGELDCGIHNLSEANDTVVLDGVLKQEGEVIHAGDGGTTLRFLFAFHCLKGREVTLTASDALKNRPVSELTNALVSLGADIEYTETIDRLPVKIHSGKLRGGTIEIGGETSSQFISALMMIGPYLPQGITLNVTGELLSWPYVMMTRNVMEHYGASLEVEGNIIRVHPGKYKAIEFTVEPDWSAASYWYEIAALCDDAEILLEGLSAVSLQGDSVVHEMMREFGVMTTFNEQGALLTKQTKNNLPEYFTSDFTGCPDLGPAIGVICGALNVTADLKGLKNFRLKESDRAAAMQRNLYDFNVKTDFCGGSKFKVYEGTGIKHSTRNVKTYHDHRMAMAFAPVAIKAGSVLIEDPFVVNKSYPGFYDDLLKAGFGVTMRE